MGETGKQAEWLIRHSDQLREYRSRRRGCRRWCYRWRQEPRCWFAVFKSGFAPDPFLTFVDEPKEPKALSVRADGV